MTNIYEVITEIHQVVREAIERHLNGYKVTQIKAASETRYAPTLVSKDTLILKDSAMDFEVTAILGRLSQTCRVLVSSDGIPHITETHVDLDY